MRGIIAEVKGKHAVILAQDGTFRKIRASANMTVGSEIDLGKTAGNARISGLAARISSIAAAALFAVGIGYGAYCYTLPYTYVDIDINPSVEFTANVFDRIIKVEALNDDAEKLLAGQDLKNASLDEGVSRLLNIAVKHGYLKKEAVSGGAGTNTSSGSIKPDRGSLLTSLNNEAAGTAVENAVLFTVSSKNTAKSADIKKKIVLKASEELEKNRVKSDVLAGEASVEQRDDARELGVTPGKLALIEDALEDRPGLTMEELKKAAVKDLINKAKAKKSAAKEKNAESELTSKAGITVLEKMIDDLRNKSGNIGDIVKQAGASGQYREQAVRPQQEQAGMPAAKSGDGVGKSSIAGADNSGIGRKAAGSKAAEDKYAEAGKDAEAGKHAGVDKNAKSSVNAESNINAGKENGATPADKSEAVKKALEEIKKRAKAQAELLEKKRQQRKKLKDELIDQIRETAQDGGQIQPEENSSARSEPSGRNVGSTVQNGTGGSTGTGGKEDNGKKSGRNVGSIGNSTGGKKAAGKESGRNDGRSDSKNYGSGS